MKLPPIAVPHLAHLKHSGDEAVNSNNTKEDNSIESGLQIDSVEYHQSIKNKQT